MKCPKCGATNVEDADFCNLCYTSFKEKTSSPKEVEEKQEPQEIKEKHIASKNLTDGSQGQAKVEIVAKLRKDFQLNAYYPALISVIGAIIISLFIPKNVPLFVESGNKATLVIILTAFCGGWIVMSKYDPLKVKRLLTGFFVGISSVFLGYIITILLWISIIRSNPTLFTKYPVDNAETVILPLLLSVGIAVFDQVEDFKFKPFLLIGVISLFGGILATILGRIVPFIHSFVFVGLICWIFIPTAKIFFTKTALYAKKSG